MLYREGLGVLFIFIDPMSVFSVVLQPTVLGADDVRELVTDLVQAWEAEAGSSNKGGNN